jgi:pimeloyl-ACP methyl ester carboxylesterase
VTEQLVCPSCARPHAASERFCSECGLPLVYPAGADDGLGPVTERHERARKIKRQYAEGELVRVAGAANQVEAEFIQGLLLEEGVPSLLRRTRGFDVPDFLAAGPRDVLVPEAGSEAARELLHQADMAAPTGTATSPSLLKLAAVIGIGGAAVALLAWLLQGGG